MVINSKIIIRELLDLIKLIKTLIFYINKLIKIAVVNKSKHLIFKTFKIILLDFQNFNNSQKFIIIIIIINLNKNYFSKIIC